MIEKYFSVNEEMKNKLQAYMKLVLEVNEVMNLTAIIDETEFIEKHFIDSLLPTKVIDFDGKKVLDVGSGAGFPGIPLAICYPNSTFVLLEPLNKRSAFLNSVVEKLNLKNVTVLCQRAEEILKVQRNSYDIVVSRAVSRLNILAEICTPYIKPNGYGIFYKGLKYEEELVEAEDAFKTLDCVVEKVQIENLPLSNQSRFNIIVKKVRENSEKFPRNYSQIKKKPL